jgi:hypothetical protein
MPPVPPQVAFRNGLLTVHAINSTMSSLLSAIREKTGIEFDGAENSSERVAVNLGPASEGDVMAGIFAGSSFDYVVLGRADSPNIVQRVILTPKGKAPPSGTFAGTQPFRQPQAQAQESDDQDTADDASLDNADQDPQDTANQPPPPPAQPPVALNQDQNNGPKTPEQLLEELKQMQLRQQQQQGQPPPNPNSVPRKIAPPQ